MRVQPLCLLLSLSCIALNCGLPSGNEGSILLGIEGDDVTLTYPRGGKLADWYAVVSTFVIEHKLSMGYGCRPKNVGHACVIQYLVRAIQSREEDNDDATDAMKLSVWVEPPLAKVVMPPFTVTNDDAPPGMGPPGDLAHSSLPCNFHGPIYLRPPWASSFGLLSKYIGFDLDLRGIHDWASERFQIAVKFKDICFALLEDSSVAARMERLLTPEEDQALLLAGACLGDLLRQVDEHVAALCARTAVDKCTNPTPLDALARLAATDKSSLFHNFAGFYDSQLAQVKSRVSDILEVGVFQGSSLKTWAAKYPCARVLGLDYLLDHVRPGRYEIAHGDQYNRTSMAAATKGRSFDIVIDDGGHTMVMQQNTLEEFWSSVRPCGCFIMEVNCEFCA